MRTILFLALVLMLNSCSSSDEENQQASPEGIYEFPFLNPELDIDTRVDDLISRMTLQEKALQLFNEAPAIERLKVPAYNWWNECLHGVARAGNATVFPQAIGLAASFDEDLMHRVGTAISDEGRAKHHYFTKNGVRSIYTGLTFWSPNINIFRDPRWGRGQETYGEDPYLTGRMAVNFIKGIQGDDPDYLKAIATVKHYGVHSGPEVSRHSDNYFVNERDLYTTYLPAFKMAVQEANVQSVMCAYNRFRDQPCCGSDLLLSYILRDEFGFEGYIVTDCGALTDFYAEGYHEVVDRPSQAWGWALSAGTDLNCEQNKAFLEDNFEEAVQQGMINEKDINRALSRLFKARFKLGMFDPEQQVPFASIPMSAVGSEEHKALALEAAQKSLVLLKNDRLLPLKEGTKVALVGPNADNLDVLVGNYNGTPTNPQTPLTAFSKKLPEGQFAYSPGGPLVPRIYGHSKPVPAHLFYHEEDGALKNGLKANYYKGADFLGAPAMSRIDSAINFNWEVSPVSGLLEETFCVQWEGYFIPEQSGTYVFSGTCDLTLDGKDILNRQTGALEDSEVRLEEGRKYKLVSRFVEEPHWWENTLYPTAHLQWVETSRDYAKEALEASATADVVVFCGGISPRLEGEEMKLDIDGFSHGDRTHLKLPANQEDLLKQLHATGKPIIYVNFSGSAMALNWQDENLPAIVQAFYPGEHAGTALFDLLFGAYSPSGKLPVTYYKSVEDLPDFLDYAMSNRTYRYFKGEVLYPFGYGLSYGDFSYEWSAMPQEINAGEALDFAVEVTNKSTIAATENLLVYLTDKEASVPVPLQSLADFKSVHLNPGESKVVNFTINADQMALINPDFKPEVEEGVFEIVVKGNTGIESQFSVKGTRLLE